MDGIAMETKQIPFEQTPEFLLGESGEDVVIAFLKSKGWHIVPSRDYNKDKGGSKAPCLQGETTGFILPDLDISCPRRGRRWVEVKTYNTSPFNRAHKINVHGVNVRHYRDYRSVEQITGAPVWLFVYEIAKGILLSAKLFNLQQYPCLCLSCRNGNTSRCLVYFNRADFHSIDLRQLDLFGGQP